MPPGFVQLEWGRSGIFAGCKTLTDMLRPKHRLKGIPKWEKQTQSNARNQRSMAKASRGSLQGPKIRALGVGAWVPGPFSSFENSNLGGTRAGSTGSNKMLRSSVEPCGGLMHVIAERDLACTPASSELYILHPLDCAYIGYRIVCLGMSCHCL